MSLSEQEQQTLREIEESLLAEDPKFGSSVSDDDSTTAAFGEGGGLTLRGVALGVLGLVGVIAGAALAQFSVWFISLSILGFLVMFGAGVWMLRGGAQSKDQLSAMSLGEKSSRSGAKKSGRGSKRKGGPSLGDKMEDSFRSRFDDK